MVVVSKVPRPLTVVISKDTRPMVVISKDTCPMVVISKDTRPMDSGY